MGRLNGSQLWDAEAGTFDEEPDHGLGDPPVRAAWRDLLLGVLPAAPARVCDLGSGTGTLSLLLAAEGYAVDGVDFSTEMVRRAVAKGAGVPNVSFVVGDAAQPPLHGVSYDAVLCRHVLWALPDPATALGRWVRLLRPGGRLVLIEGRWSTGAGLTADQTLALTAAAGLEARLTPLPEAVYWGREISDERYLLVASTSSGT